MECTEERLVDFGLLGDVLVLEGFAAIRCLGFLRKRKSTSMLAENIT